MIANSCPVPLLPPHSVLNPLQPAIGQPHAVLPLNLLPAPLLLLVEGRAIGATVDGVGVVVTSLAIGGPVGGRGSHRKKIMMGGMI